jgi:hypothetical protein
MIFNKTGQVFTEDFKLYPGDVCLFTTKSNCGVPAFQGKNQLSDFIEIHSIDYDQADL